MGRVSKKRQIHSEKVKDAVEAKAEKRILLNEASASCQDNTLYKRGSGGSGSVTKVVNNVKKASEDN